MVHLLKRLGFGENIFIKPRKGIMGLVWELPCQHWEPNCGLVGVINGSSPDQNWHKRRTPRVGGESHRRRETHDAREKGRRLQWQKHQEPLAKFSSEVPWWKLYFVEGLMVVSTGGRGQGWQITLCPQGSQGRMRASGVDTGCMTGNCNSVTLRCWKKHVFLDGKRISVIQYFFPNNP